MASLPFALYDAFTDSAFGGSQAAIVSEAALLDAGTMGRIVQELGLPAIGFVSATGPRSVDACFRSTVMELPMCGHGTVALMTWMTECGCFGRENGDAIEVELRLPGSTANVTISRRTDGRPLIMLAVRSPSFRCNTIDRERLAGLLGIAVNGFAPDLPVETASADFVHLVVPVRDLDTMRRVVPDFPGLIAFCHDHAIETVALFSREVEQPESMLHVRDFCPAVGVAESAAAGTTNAALTGYLIRHRTVSVDADGRVEVRAEQGMEINRPSAITSRARLEGDVITHLEVGGVATKIAEGTLLVPAA